MRDSLPLAVFSKKANGKWRGPNFDAAQNGPQVRRLDCVDDPVGFVHVFPMILRAGNTGAGLAELKPSANRPNQMIFPVLGANRKSGTIRLFE